MKNFNRLALQGVDIDDNEFVKEFNLNPNLAGTPEINDAILNVMYEKNIKNYINDGIPINEAKSKAGRLRAEAKKEIQALL
jgi:hypothetical protein